MNKKNVNPFDMIAEFLLQKQVSENYNEVEDTVVSKLNKSKNVNTLLVPDIKRIQKIKIDNTDKVKILSFIIQILTIVFTIYFWVMLIMFFGLKMALIYIGINVLLFVLIVLGIVLSILVNPIAILLSFISATTTMLFITSYPFYLLAISSKKKYKAGMYSSIILIVGILLINILSATGAYIQKKQNQEKA